MQNLKPCPFRNVDDEGHILCNKIKKGDREVSPNICRACPISAINCLHLRATLDHSSRPPITVHYGNGKTQVWDHVAPAIALERAACAAKVIPILGPRDCAGCALRQALVNPDGLIRPAAPIAPPVGQTPQPAPGAVAQSAPVARTRATRRKSAPAGAPTVVYAEAGAAANAVPSHMIAETRAQEPQSPLPQASPVQAPPPQPVAVAPTASAPSPVAPPAAKAEQDQAEKRRSGIVAEKIIKLQEWLEKQKAAPQAPAPDREDIETRISYGMPRPAPRPRGEEKRVGWTD